MDIDELIGKRFGHLLVIEKIDNYNQTGRPKYKCLCDCGNYCYYSKAVLVNSIVQSCGCVKCELKKLKQNRVGEKYGKLEIIEMLPKGYVRCICECGEQNVTLIYSIIRGTTKSCGCIERESRYNRQNHEKDLTGMTFGHLTVIEKTDKRYSNGGVGWLCECDCGKRKIIRSGNLLRGKTRSCGCNKISKYEELVESILDELNIKYEREYRFSECRNHFPLPFDFYIELGEKRFCIECQGQQHYIPVDHFGGKERFKTLVLNDNIKKQFCENNNITLICLPYTLSNDEARRILNNNLNPVTITVA